MPYIKPIRRPPYRDVLDQLPAITCKGDLEYCIMWLQNHYMLYKNWSFDYLHDAVYAAQHCADEFRRQHLDKREDFAKAINGDVE
jgi:hypothetical protein